MSGFREAPIIAICHGAVQWRILMILSDAFPGLPNKNLRWADSKRGNARVRKRTMKPLLKGTQTDLQPVTGTAWLTIATTALAVIHCYIPLVPNLDH